mmetsp:Transcript_6939/g.12774  ORF Transcript_6939/g.12774 Transcript_6939/m.12774 type:complete len:210 (+) Transcript_6939:619-1248(+)
MISAVKMVTPISAAICLASAFAVTSNARITAYSSRCSRMTAAFITSFLWTGPIASPDTGTLLSSRKHKRASREPSVLAWTYTPFPEGSTRDRMEARSDIHSSLRSSTSSLGPQTSSCVPATAWSSPLAVILTPIAALISLWWTYSDLTRISFIGGGVRRARIEVTMGPCKPHITIVSPSRSTPLTKTTSMVVPRPSTFLTSSTVHCRSV